MEATSLTLLMRLKQDGAPREVAWADFRRRYAPIIAGFARNLGAADQDIDDLIQDVLTGFYSAQPTFMFDPDKGRFRGYLKTCVINLLARRHNKKLQLDGRPIEEIDPGDDSAERAWQASWEREQLHRAIEDVRKYYQDNETFQAFYRVTMAGDDPKAVATALDLSVDSVYQAKTRCTARLRSVLAQLEDEEG